ncbi:MAG: hypothetical protein JWM85_3101 [Acidimicrobiaceae bacterium]|nr:hypothetical protein [Acidimicrobiaceae bacterium]
MTYIVQCNSQVNGANGRQSLGQPVDIDGDAKLKKEVIPSRKSPLGWYFS